MKLRFNSVKTKILALALITTVCFVGYLLFMYSVSQENTKRLSHIREVSYPVLSRAAKSRALLQNLNKTLEVAVTTSEESMIDEAQALAEELLKQLQDIEAIAPSESVAIGSFVRKFQEYREQSVSLVNQLIQGTTDFAELMDAKRASVAAYDAIDNDLLNYQQDQEKLLDDQLMLTDNESEKVLKVGIAMGCAILALVCLVSAWIAYAITRNLKVVELSLYDMSQGEGDLTKRIPKQTNDEIGDLVDGFNDFVAHLQNIVRQVIDGIQKMGTSIQHVLETIDTTKEGADSQKAHIIQVVTAIEEMAQSVLQVVEHVQETTRLTEASANTAGKGQQIVTVAISEIRELATQVFGSGETIQELHQISGQIGSVTSIIRDVSEQTNLLALNAAIEAARAGEQGRGFAVVAEEVRHLATRTGDCTASINEIVQQLQTKSSHAVDVMKQSCEQAESGVNRVTEAGDAFGHLLESISDIRNNNVAVAQAAKEQQSVSTEIAHNMADVREITVDTSESMSKTTDAAASLSDLASNLSRLITQFKV